MFRPERVHCVTGSREVMFARIVSSVSSGSTLWTTPTHEFVDACLARTAIPQMSVTARRALISDPAATSTATTLRLKFTRTRWAPSIEESCAEMDSCVTAVNARFRAAGRNNTVSSWLLDDVVAVCFGRDE